MNPDKPADTGESSTTGSSGIERGSAIGRYLVLGLIGKGGMGEVYAAYDPELDRKVALKLLRVQATAGVDPSENRSRLLREAQAIAKLSHPNVVVMFDVGTFNDRVFLAMEFVDGYTLGSWLEAKARGWPEIIATFAAAGRGLACVHKAGLVHRDFKPDNVMIGCDGQVRVMDFGLARAIGEPSLIAATPRVDSATPAPESRLTVTGAMMGTPAFMAPEQFRGGTIDARGDQFSFCVSLYQALYGERPFAGNGLHELTKNVLAGRVRDAPSGTRVPGWVRRVVLRGLRVNRADRHASMDALLAMLARDPARTRRWWAVAAAIGTLIAVLGVSLLRAERQQQVKCQDASVKLAGIWELPNESGLSPSKEAVRRAFIATGKRYAADSFALVKSTLDRYVTAWDRMHREACEATNVRGEQSADALDLRMSCLADRLSEVRALAAVLKDADGDVVGKAVAASQSLRPIDQCADVATLRSVIKPADDPAVRRAVAETRNQLADVKVLTSAGRYNKAMEKTGEVAEAALATKYQPVMAEALMQLGELHADTGDGPKAEISLEQAVWLAEASRHDMVAAQSATDLIYAVGYLQARFVDGERWARLAAAALGRLGPGHDVIAAWRANNLALVYLKQGRFEDSLASSTEAVSLKIRALGAAHFDVATSELNLAQSLFALGRIDEAIARNQHALTITRTALGPNHPQIAMGLVNAAEFMNAKQRYGEAREMANQAIAIWEGESGSDQPFLGYPLTAIGVSLVDDGQPALAIPYLERALKIRDTKDPQADVLGQTRFALARALWATKKGHARALSLAGQARANYKGNPAATKESAEIDQWMEDRKGRPRQLAEAAVGSMPTPKAPPLAHETPKNGPSAIELSP
jgi:tetratricopeptide (TPR) repeat protein/predicted Ser/Thr protein kinase